MDAREGYSNRSVMIEEGSLVIPRGLRLNHGASITTGGASITTLAVSIEECPALRAALRRSIMNVGRELLKDFRPYVYREL